jgi:hypothetical protein
MWPLVVEAIVVRRDEGGVDGSHGEELGLKKWDQHE